MTTQEFLNTNFDHMLMPDIDPGGLEEFEWLNVADFDINNLEQYQRRRATTPRVGAPWTAWNPIIDHGARIDKERTIYRRILANDPSLPPVNWSGELSPLQVTAVYVELEMTGVFDQLWPFSHGGYQDWNQVRLPTRREMWELIRDSGYAYGPSLTHRERGEWMRIVWVLDDPAQPTVPWWVHARSP